MEFRGYIENTDGSVSAFFTDRTRRGQPGTRMPKKRAGGWLEEGANGRGTTTVVAGAGDFPCPLSMLLPIEWNDVRYFTDETGTQRYDTKNSHFRTPTWSSTKNSPIAEADLNEVLFIDGLFHCRGGKSPQSFEVPQPLLQMQPTMVQPAMNPQGAKLPKLGLR